jgi:hypothetical protein
MSAESRSLLQRIYRAAVSYIEWPSFEDLMDGDISEENSVKACDHMLLGKYGLDMLTAYVDKSGVSAALRARGFDRIRVDIDTSDNFVHKFFIFNDDPTVPDLQERLLVELVIRRVRDVLMFKSIAALVYNSSSSKLQEEDVSVYGRECVKQLSGMNNLDFIVIEWLRMQDPTNKELKALFPGQEYPSLGIGKVFFAAITGLAKTAERDGLVNIPLYFHSAQFYFKNGHQFINPVFQGIFTKLLVDIDSDLAEHGLLLVSLAILKGGLFARFRGEEYRRVKWNGQEMILALSQRLSRYLTSSSYASVSEQFYINKSTVFKLEYSDMASEEEWKQSIAIFDVDTRLFS